MDWNGGTDGLVAFADALSEYSNLKDGLKPRRNKALGGGYMSFLSIPI